jgi:hypothetical protein
MDVECRVCLSGLLICCNEHLYCSQACYDLDKVEHIGILEGVRGLSNFEGKLTDFIMSLANLRDAKIKVEYNDTHLSGSLKDIQARAAALQQQAKMEGQVGAAAYAVGKMMDGIRVPGDKANRPMPSVGWNGKLTKFLGGMLNDAEKLSTVKIDLTQLYAEIHELLNNSMETQAIEAELTNQLNRYLGVASTAPATRSGFYGQLRAGVKAAAAKYDAIYKSQGKVTKAAVKEAKKPSSGKSGKKSSGSTPVSPPVPVKRTSPPGTALPKGWAEGVDKDGTTYYYNETTQESSWERPT